MSACLKYLDNPYRYRGGKASRLRYNDDSACRESATAPQEQYLGEQIIALDAATPIGFEIPDGANSVQLEFVGENEFAWAKYSYDGDPVAGAYHRLRDGQELITHTPNMGNFLAVLGTDSGPGSLHAHYHFVPDVNDHG